MLGVAVAAGSIAWLYRDELLLAAVGFAIQRRQPVGPTQPVVWQSGVDAAGRSPSERPPNIVLIVADDLGWNDLTLHGGVADGSVPTPHIDALARAGVNFSSGYSASGTCAPSRAAIMTGRYPTRFGFEFTPTPPGMSSVLPMIANRMPGRLRPVLTPDAPGSELPFDEMGVPASEITLAELLAGAGYHNVHIGKWHLGGAAGMAPHQQGFHESLLLANGLYLPEDHPDAVNARVEFDPIDRFLWRVMQFAASYNGGPAFAPPGYVTDYYTDEAVKVIEANRERPFFLYLAHWAVHTPLQATRDDYEALAHIPDHRRRVYAAMLRALDRSVGRVLDALRANGLEENTLVFFTSDNGGPNYIGLPEINQPLRGWKITFFEGGIRVPYFVKWPARIPAGAAFEEPVHGFDIYATAAAAAGVAPPVDRVIDGVDLLPFARGERSDVPHRELFWRSGHYQVARSGDWKLQRNLQPHERVWLFDVRADPSETTDLAAREPQRVDELRRRLAEFAAQQAQPLWPSRAEMPVNLDKTLLDADAPDDEFVYWPN